MIVDSLSTDIREKGFIMSFTSLEFIIFLLTTFFLYYTVEQEKRWILLLVANYIFYSFAGVQYLLLLVYIIVAAYISAKYVHKRKKYGKQEIVLAVLALIIPLLFFKYTGFIADNINIILSAISSAKELSTMKIALPLGISFYTFTALGYVADVAQKKYSPYTNIFHLATSLSFFPCLVSGPIERQNKLIPQVLSGKEFDYKKATYGLKLIAWGLFEKVVIADNLAIYVDKVFVDVHAYNGAPLLIASLFFTFQIYCDFAGYSDIARGVAKLFGIELTKNFDCPYFSKSVQEFWRRWHISLSSWLRDYVYIPLGGNRKGNIRKQLNIVITMLVSGIWHGAAWTFIAWGGAYGIAQVFENVTGINKINFSNRLINFVRILIVFSICSTLWVFFKATTFADAWYLITHMFNGITDIHSYVINLKDSLKLGKGKLSIILFALIILFVYDYHSLKKDVIEFISSKPLLIRWTTYVVFVIMIVWLSNKGETVNFVYAGF